MRWLYIKDFILKHKKFTWLCVFAFAFGIILSWSNVSELSKQEIGNSGLYTNIDYNKLKTDYENLEIDFTILSNQVSTLVEEQKKLQSELTIVSEKYLEDQKLLFAEEQDEYEYEPIENHSLTNNSDSSSNKSTSNTSNNSNGHTSNSVENTTPVTSTVWITQYGTKYHKHNNCGSSKHVSEITLEQAKARGINPCGTCYGG